MLIEYYKSQILSTEMEYFANCIAELQFKLYANDVLPRIGIIKQTDFEVAINKADSLCRLTNFPVSKHFKVIYKEKN